MPTSRTAQGREPLRDAALELGHPETAPECAVARVQSGSPFEAQIGFSRAVRIGAIVAVSGTAPVWPDGEVDPDPRVQAQRCWEIALSALGELGGRPRDVIRTRQFLTRLEAMEGVSLAHAEVFAEVRPASTMVIVEGLLDPRWVVEVELDAIVSDPTAARPKPTA